MAGAWLAAAAFGAALVQGGDGKVPSGKWVVNFEESRCVASREYGSPDRLLTLALKAPVKGDVIQLVVLRDSRNAASAQQVEGSVGLPGAVKPVSALTFATTDGKRRVYLLNLPMSEVEGWGDGGALTLRAGSGLDESLRVSGLRPLLKVMRECVADLGRHWNYAGKDGPPKVRQEPKGSLVIIFSANDYPAEAIRKSCRARCPSSS